MTKKVWLWLACLVLLLSFLGCEVELPTSPDIPEGGFPIISYFCATPSQISAGEYSILSWNVHVSGLASHHTLKVIIHCEDGISAYDSGVMEVERAGTMEVCPKVTTIYTLTAYVVSNSVSEFVIVTI